MRIAEIEWMVFAVEEMYSTITGCNHYFKTQFLKEDENGGIALCSNRNPSQKITAEDLEDGTMLESSIHNFIREKNQDHFLDILKYDEDLFFPIFSNPEAI